jgi:tetratricopeptide (TPR) repeat protein
MRALRAWTSGDKAEQADVLGALPAARALALGIAFCDVALYSGDLAGAETFGRRCLEAAHSPELRAVANLVLAHAALARGRVGAAFAAVDAAEIAAPAWAREVRGFFAALPFVPVSAATLDQIERQLLDARPAEEPPGSGLPLALHNGLHPHLHAWVRGLLAARRGKGDRLAACVEELAELAVPQGGEALLEHLVRTLEALSLRAREKPREALRALQSARSEIWFQFTVASPFYAGTFERFLRAELLADTGREEEAIAWYRSLAERSPFELIFSAPAAARQLRILDRAGRREEAERLRARLGRQLNGADVEYRRCLERGDWWG